MSKEGRMMRIALGFGFSALVVVLLAGAASGVGWMSLLVRGAAALVVFTLVGGLVENLVRD